MYEHNRPQCLKLLTTIFFQTVFENYSKAAHEMVLSGSRHSIHHGEGMFALVLLIVHHRNAPFVLELHKKVAFLLEYSRIDFIRLYNDLRIQYN